MTHSLASSYVQSVRTNQELLIRLGGVVGAFMLIFLMFLT